MKSLCYKKLNRHLYLTKLNLNQFLISVALIIMFYKFIFYLYNLYIIANFPSGNKYINIINFHLTSN